MQVIQKSAATAAYRRMYFRLISTADDTSGVTGATVTVGIRKNGGASAAGAGTTTELSDGYYYYEATTGEVDTLGSVLAKFSATGAHTFSYEIMIVDYDPFASPLTSIAIASAVRTELTTELGRIDAPISGAALPADIATALDAQGLTTAGVALLLLSSSLSGKDWTRTGNVITCTDGTVITLTVSNGIIVGYDITPAP